MMSFISHAGFILCWVTLACFAAGPLQAASPVVISEFVAANNQNYADEDGAFPDWIELHNTSDDTVSLSGWHLTDDVTAPTKWTFPPTNLLAGRYLVVFASGKDRRVPGAPLHANFQLDSQGEYLALVMPDGQPASRFTPSYPPQLDGLSYGLEQPVTTTALVTNGSTVRWSVPLNQAGQPSDWASTNFVDSLWNTGRTGLGFDASPSNLVFSGPATNVALGKPTSQSSLGFGFGPELAVNGNLDDFTHTAAGQNLPARWEVNLTTNYGIERIVLHNRSSCCGSRLRDITVRILDANGVTNFTSALLNPENVLGSGLNGPDLSLNLTQLTGGLVMGARVRVTRTPDPDLSGTAGQGNADEADVLSLGEVEVFGVPAVSSSYLSSIRTDVATQMRNINSSVLLRVPFLVVAEDLPILDRLTLRMKYDDGFVAFLNGVKVAEANAPATLAWNSSATTERPRATVLQFEQFDLTGQIGLLQDGINILAFQALNRSADDDELLVLPELSGVSVGETAERYFSQPSPGAANGTGFIGSVADTKFSVDRGFFDVPFTVAITTATAGAVIRYTTNGSAPSAVNGLVYTSPLLISRTTVLRALASKPGYRPSNVDTHTYLFLNQVVAQSHQSTTNAGYPNTWSGIAADYAMDPRITGPYGAQMVASLRSLPSVFFTTSISNLFDATTGMYSHPTTHGAAWERPVSMEMVGTNGETEFQVDCGLRIQGGYFRDASVTQKHSLRVLFRAEYGAGKLQHDLFEGDDATREFDTLVLRAGANDGYSWNEAKDTEQFTRDEFGRGLHRAMGHAAPHGLFLHVYLNGVYWGLYNLCERPNEDFSAAYYGGEPAEWDSNNAGDVKNGDLQAWNAFTGLTPTTTTLAAYERLQGNNPDGSRNLSYPVYLDKLNYIDYMIANIWGGNWDWPNKNFWFGRSRTTNSTGFKFYMWDFENTMGNNRARSPVNMVSPRAGTETSWVGQPHAFLKNLPEYRLDFADRVQRYFFNDGLLTTSQLTNRYRLLVDPVELSILAESARWGDDNLNPPQDIEDWRRERDWLLGTYLPQRSAVVLQQFRSAGLYPNVSAPSFSQAGGTVPDGYQLEITQTNAGGVIYFTTDGSDPRLRGGAVNPAAQAYASPLPITTAQYVRARVLVGTIWSALMEGVLHPPQDFSHLLISEIMYHPPNVGLVDGDEFEFLEFKNAGGNALNLSGLRFVAGITYTFTNGTILQPGGFLVLARNPAQFATKYPGVTVHGTFSGRLDNNGETLRLVAPSGGPVLSYTYNDRAPWSVAADGLGFSIVPVNPNANAFPDQASSWRSSAAPGGSPGSDDPTPNIPAIVVTEVLTASVSPQRDAIELLNPTTVAANIGGWYLSDDPSTPQKYRIPTGTIIAAGEFLTFNESQFNAEPGATNNFSLHAEGDQVYLFSADASGNLTGYSHGFAFGASDPGATFGRLLLTTGEEDFPTQVSASLGSDNVGPKVGPLVLNEIHYHPASAGEEFIELRNVTDSPVFLYDPATPAHTWRLNGVGFDFPPGVTLAAQGLLLVVQIEPELFRAKYDVPNEVPIFGPYAGELQDSGERLELQKPGPPDTNTAFAYINVDAVRYNDRAPWPPAADGSGPSLQKKSALTYGNEPTNWEGALPTPGRIFVPGTPPEIVIPPADVTAVATHSVTLRVVAEGQGVLSYQWRHNGDDIPGAIGSELTLSNLQLNQAGDYTVLVFNAAGSVESAPARLSLLLPVSISREPSSVALRGSTNNADYGFATNNATFTVGVNLQRPTRLEWRRNGVAIANATNATLTISNVWYPRDEGDYDVVVTDALSSVASAKARLTVLLSPIVLVPPLEQMVPSNGSFSASVVIRGNPPPFRYEWREISAMRSAIITNETSSFFTFGPVTNSTTRTWRLVITNAAGPPSGLVSQFNVTALADTDGDGLPDTYEQAFGLNTNEMADAQGDLDQDGMTNRDEYLAGTNPLDSDSYLRVDQTVPSGGAGVALVHVGAASNRTYTVQYTEQLGAGRPWTRLANIPARPVARVETIPDPNWSTNRFYRVLLPAQ